MDYYVLLKKINEQDVYIHNLEEKNNDSNEMIIRQEIHIENLRSVMGEMEEQINTLRDIVEGNKCLGEVIDVGEDGQWIVRQGRI